MDFVPAARSYVQTTYPALAAAAPFALPSVAATLDDVVEYMGTAEEAVFAAAEPAFKAGASLTPTQANAYDALRTAWQHAQLTTYQLARRLVENAFPANVAASLASGIAYPGWLPRRAAGTATALDLTPDLRDAQGKRIGIWSSVSQWLAEVHARYPNTPFALEGAADLARQALGDLDAAGMSAKLLVAQSSRQLAPAATHAPNVSATPHASGVATAQRQALEAQALREVHSAARSNTWIYLAVGTVFVLGLGWLFFRNTPSSAPRRLRTAGVGVGSPTRLRSLNDPSVPSRYGLEVQ